MQRFDVATIARRRILRRMQDFRKIRVWHLSKGFAIAISEVMTPKACRSLPGLRAQIIRASISIPANIAEGCARPPSELKRFLEVSLGSAHEVETHLVIAEGTGILSPQDFRRLMAQLDTIRKMIINFIGSLRDAE
jgi:four helix bundle protein